MFRSCYGLSFNPFDKELSPEKDLFHSRDMDQMLGRLDYLKDTRGIGVFTARPGMGKSFALRCFAKSLNPNLYHMEYICLSTVNIMFIFPTLMSNTHTNLVLKKPKTESSIRKVWIPKTVAYILREWKQIQDQYKEYLGQEFYDYNLVLTLPNGRPVENRIMENQPR